MPCKFRHVPTKNWGDEALVLHRGVWFNRAAISGKKKALIILDACSETAIARGGNGLHGFKDVRTVLDMAQAKTIKCLKRRQESGLDWLICPSFARQQTDLRVVDLGRSTCHISGKGVSQLGLRIS